MNKNELYKYVDHTVLKAVTSWEEVETLCNEALTYNMASVCIPSCYVKRAKEAFDELNICTVVGFPLGYTVTAAKLAETTQAIKDGASEIDMVINLTDVKNKRYDLVEAEISALKEATGNLILKVIIETCYLTEEEKIKMCEIVTNAGADYIKTSTGFGTGGATIEDVKLMKAHIGSKVKVKASGGVRSKEEFLAYIEAGAERIGTSSAISMLEN